MGEVIQEVDPYQAALGELMILQDRGTQLEAALSREIVYDPETHAVLAEPAALGPLRRVMHLEFVGTEEVSEHQSDPEAVKVPLTCDQLLAITGAFEASLKVRAACRRAQSAA